jgi:hypothetical protein
MEADVITFEGNSNRMEATNLELNPEETEAAVERQELHKKDINFDSIGSLKDRYGERCLVVRRRRWAKKQIQDCVGCRQKVSPARKRQIAVPSLQCARGLSVRGLERCKRP